VEHPVAVAGKRVAKILLETIKTIGRAHREYPVFLDIIVPKKAGRSMQTKTVHHIEYYLPQVTLLRDSGIGVAEIAARTCYDSFAHSENEAIRNAMESMDIEAINAIDDSELLQSLAWVHHHHSIIEHSTLHYLIRGTSRGVLQEHARHRIQSISVRSTRYTMSSVIHAFVAAINSGGSDGLFAEESRKLFVELVRTLDLLVIADEAYQKIEIGGMYDKLKFQYDQNPEAFIEAAVAKSSRSLLEQYGTDGQGLFGALESGKRKRNVGDAFKHIVTDNWKVDMVVTFNLRSLKNYFDLRTSGAAWFQIRWLAEAMKAATPEKYLKLIDKRYNEV
jgi:thymidylate synthase (FAD)